MKKVLFNVLLFTLNLFELTLCCSVDSNESEPCDSTEYGVFEGDFTTNCTCGTANKEDARIINGKETMPNEYPLMAGLVDIKKDMIVCGSAIITQRHVLTAAHCTRLYKPSDLLIHVGYHTYTNGSKKGQILTPIKFYPHPKYYFINHKYDISIIFVKEIIDFNEHVGPACLPKTKIELVRETVKVLGWGETKFEGEVSNVLRKVYLLVKPLEECNYYLPGVVMNDIHQICTFRPNRDSCRGDSGGPVLWRDPDTNRYTLVAVVSRGMLCDKYPSINTEVYYFLSWIQEIISNTDGTYKTCTRMD